MADRSNYADKPSANDICVPPGSLPINFGARTYDPTAGHDDGEGGAHSKLFEHSLGGDWSWKPERDKALGYDMPSLGIVSEFRTYRGFGPSPAEEAAHVRHLRGEPGALRFDSATGTILRLAA